MRFKKKYSKTQYVVWVDHDGSSKAFNATIDQDLMAGRGQWVAWVDEHRIGVARSYRDIKLKVEIHIRHLIENEGN